MPTAERLDAADLDAVITVYRDVLRSHRHAINRLNVYPVPDGDTGTNMALTLDSVVAELPVDGHDMVGVAHALSHGSLMGARGNSGVILSQILRGIAETVSDLAAVDAEVAVAALRRASDGAYRAVQHPVEGTMLTVIREAAEAAEATLAPTAATPDASAPVGLMAVLTSARDQAASALARTPELLEALRVANVVDAGGAGLLLLFDVLLHVAGGRPLPPPPPVEESAAVAIFQSVRGFEPAVALPGASRVTEGTRYEVMFLLDAPDEAIVSFRDLWAGIGDSIVVVGGEGTWNCHIHTDDIGAAIEAGLDVGRPRRIHVTDLWEQVEEERWVREAGSRSGPQPSGDPVTCAVVAVCSGDGIRRIFHSLGVDQTVSGGQSMNPSTAELLAAIAEAPAAEVVLLPNNKNIVAVAEQAAAQAAKEVRVVPTIGIPEAFAALLEYDPEGSAAANAEVMSAGASRVTAGEVTRAVRPSRCEAGLIEVGDWLGLSRSGIEVVAPALADAAIGLLDRLIDEGHHEIVTIIAGVGATAADTRRITEWLADRPAIAAEVHHGGQPLYPYLFGVE
jgi:DAK2 domain fusion protein YloV